MLAPGKAAHGKASVHELQIPDGGGLGSTAVWLKPQENLDVLKPLRRCFMDLAKVGLDSSFARTLPGQTR